MAAADAPWCADSPEAAALAALVSAGAPEPPLLELRHLGSFSVESTHAMPAFRGGGLATGGLEVVDASMLRGVCAAPGGAGRIIDVRRGIAHRGAPRVPPVPRRRDG